MMDAIIIDDEFKSRSSLQAILKEYFEEINVVGSASTIKEGARLVISYDPDVIFLDVQMKGETGFDLFKKLPNLTAEVIFVTAHADYAIKAFRFSALDYLLKPVAIDQLQSAINKLKNKKSLDINQRIQNLLNGIEQKDKKEKYKLALPTAEGLYFVRMEEIIYCEAKSNYTQVVLKNEQKYMVSKTLKEYEEMLSDHDFFRIHHSYLINLKEIQRYIRGEGGYVVLTNNIKLDVSKRRKEAFMSKISS